MAYRFTETKKWDDVWFSDLKPLSKLLFLYMCDQCDIAGFLEVNVRKMCFDIGVTKDKIEDSLKELDSRLLYSIDGKLAFVINFIRHQKNVNLNPNNNAHRGIIKRLEDNIALFNLESYHSFLAPNEGLGRGTGKGIGNGKVGDIGGVEEKEDITESFENFFHEYHRITKLKKSDKEAALKKWKQLSKTEYKKAFDNIQNYYDSLPDKKYCKKARTYLNDKNFNDEFSAPLFPVITDVKLKNNELQ